MVRQLPAPPEPLYPIELKLARCVTCGAEKPEGDLLYKAGWAVGQERDPRFWFCNHACFMHSVYETQLMTGRCLFCGSAVRRSERGGPVPAYCERKCRDQHKRSINSGLRRVARTRLPEFPDSASVETLLKVREELAEVERETALVVAWWDDANATRGRARRPDGVLEIPPAVRKESGRFARLLSEFRLLLNDAIGRCEHLLVGAAQHESAVGWQQAAYSGHMHKRRLEDQFAAAIEASVVDTAANQGG